MSALIARIQQGSESRWAKLVSAAPHRPEDSVEVHFLASSAATTAQLLAELSAGAGQPADHASVSAGDFLSPVTTDATLICQGLNYREHAAEAGHHIRKANLFFQKGSSSLSSPYGDIVRPGGVELLDYEVEIGVVLRCSVGSGTLVTTENIGDFVAGFVLCNDVSARDTMFGAAFFQWFQGKSYRTFCPVGPVLYLLEPSEVAASLDSLHITLELRGEVRQSASSSQLIHKIPDTLNQIGQFMDLKAGDLLLTGTPGGVLAHPTPDILGVLKTHLFDDERRKKELVKGFKQIDPFLQPGDLLTLSFKDKGQDIDLGGQYCRIV